MKICKLFLASMSLMLISSMSYAVNYGKLMSPNSLGKNIYNLKRKYNLKFDVNRPEFDTTNQRYNFSIYKNNCSIVISTDIKYRVQSLQSFEDCNYSGKSSNIKFNSSKTRVVDILNQTKLSNVIFYPQDFIPPHYSIAPSYNLKVKRLSDNYSTSFEFENGNKSSPYLKSIARAVYPYADNYAERIGELVEMSDKSLVPILSTDKIRKKAIRTYNMSNKPISITISYK